MRILGIDPGLATTGYAVLDGHGRSARLVEAGTVSSNRRKPLEERLGTIYTGIKHVMEEFAPEALAVEDLYSSYKNPRTAIVMGHARGVIYLCAGEMGLPVHAYPPRKVKLALVGSGAATKRQVQMMIQMVFKLDRPPEPDDVADAAAVALCHARIVAGQPGDMR